MTSPRTRSEHGTHEKELSFKELFVDHVLHEQVDLAAGLRQFLRLHRPLQHARLGADVSP